MLSNTVSFARTKRKITELLCLTWFFFTPFVWIELPRLDVELFFALIGFYLYSNQNPSLIDILPT